MLPFESELKLQNSKNKIIKINQFKNTKIKFTTYTKIKN